MKRLLFLSLCTVFIFSCASTASYQRETSGMIGCPPDEIQIVKHSRLSWTASCRGRSFVCGYIASGGVGQSSLVCTPEIK
jgi:hypothetical protein